jgi:hypothetical protein
MSHGLRDGRRAGVLISSAKDRDRVRDCDLVQCVHCQFTTVWTPGSGRYWGWCTKCSGFYCGWKPECRDQCVPALQMIENLEKGRPADYVPTWASNPRGVSVGGVLLG